jgi:thiosulfate dehydrogenase
MSPTSLRCHLGSALGGMACLLLAGFFMGCSEQGTGPKSATPVSGKRPAASASVATPASLAVAAEPKVTKPLASAAVKPGPKPESKGEEATVKVGACDGGGAVEVAKGTTGQALADSLMDQWKRNHPEAKWVAEEKERHTLQPPADNSDLLKGGQAKGDTYGNFTERDLLTWARETEKFAAEGSRIFHNADLLGSTVAVSCDMCHPHAANTHPETYPKFQVQLGRVVLLRDMINWCVENPVRATKLDPDGPKMRALEAYILSQRKGVAMNYGKH